MNELAGMLRAGTHHAAPARIPRFDQGVFLMHLNRGRQLFEAGRIQEARQEVEEALELRPDDEMALNVLGMIYFKLDMRPDAARVYRLLLQLHPEADVLHCNLGVLEFKEGRYDDARRRLETALLLNPKNLRPHLYLGLIERRQGNLGACLEHLRAAGSEELIARLEIPEARSAGLEGPPDDGDTGPMRAIDPAAGPAAVDLLGALKQASERSGMAAEGGETAFTIVAAGGPGGCDRLILEFSQEVAVRSGSALRLRGEGGSLHATTPGADGMMTLRGRGCVDLVPSGSPGGRVLLLRLSRGQELRVGDGRLLAHEAGILAEGSARHGETPISRMPGQILTGARRVSGEGILALAAGRRAEVIRLSAGDLLLIHPRDLVCWSAGVRGRPASTGGFEQLLVPGTDAVSPASMEGAGDVLIDAPA